MFPGYTPEHVRNMTLRNAVDFGKFILILTGGATLAYFNDLGSGKDSAFVSFAAVVWFVWTFGLSTFADHIVNIIEVCAKKKMSRIAAELIVAFMQNMQVVWNRSICQGPSNTVRTLWSAIYRHCSITVTACTGLPVPAIIWALFVDSGPKAIFDGLPVVMAVNVTRLMTWLFCSFQALTASASAKFGSIPFTGAATVTNDISERFAFYMPSAAVVLGDYFGFLAASALAVSVGDFLRGLIRGMLAHVSSSFRLLTMPRAVVAAPWLFYWRTTGVIIA
jgi:hypothetical protein